MPESVVLTTFIVSVPNDACFLLKWNFCKLPPDDGPLVELQKTLQFILEVANDLQLALASLQESNPLVNVLRVISQLRQALSKPGRALQAAYEHAVGCAKLYHEISRHMLTNRPQAEERIGLTLESVAVTLSGFRGASASINSATQDFRQSAERVKSVFDTMDLGEGYLYRHQDCVSFLDQHLSRKWMDHALVFSMQRVQMSSKISCKPHYVRVKPLRNWGTIMQS